MLLPMQPVIFEDISTVANREIPNKHVAQEYHIFPVRINRSCQNDIVELAGGVANLKLQYI